MKVTYLGHSAVLLEGSRTIYIDPFLTGNDRACLSVDDVNKADFVAVTHDHDDHLGDAFEICRRTGATLVSIFEITCRGEGEGLAVEPMSIGGSIETEGVRFSLVNAVHSSPGSDPTGVIVEMDGKTVYHMGDTALTSDMALLPDFFRIDLALVPVGDRFTMGGASAARAVKMCGAKIAVPIHYGTFPIIDATPDRFVEAAKDVAEIRVLDPGESTEL